MKYKELPKDIENWKAVERPGFFGKHIDEVIEKYNSKYGEDNWKVAWLVGSNLHWPDNIKHGRLVDFEAACHIYESSYLQYFSTYPEKLEKLVSIASDVYDNAKSNVDSGLDYNIQEANGTHIQDIAVRNVLKKLGMEFKGDKLVEVRSSAEGKDFSPQNVLFYAEFLTMMPYLEGWWSRGENRGITTEQWYQSNKVIITNNKK